MSLAPASWCEEARAKLAAMETLIKQGRGDALVPSGGCTEPGGGIIPTTRTAHQMAADLRGLIQLIRCPDQVMLSGTPLVGFGQAEIVAPAAVATSPWAVALATSVVGAATGWVIEEIATRVRGRRRQ